MCQDDRGWSGQPIKEQFLRPWGEPSRSGRPTHGVALKRHAGSLLGAHAESSFTPAARVDIGLGQKQAVQQSNRRIARALFGRRNIRRCVRASVSPATADYVRRPASLNAEASPSNTSLLRSPTSSAFSGPIPAHAMAMLRRSGASASTSVSTSPPCWRGRSTRRPARRAGQPQRRLRRRIRQRNARRRCRCQRTVRRFGLHDLAAARQLSGPDRHWRGRRRFGAAVEVG